MSVWLAIPSKRPAHEAEKAIGLWRERGYKIALAVDPDHQGTPVHDMALVGEYRGYARAVNELTQLILKDDPQCDWIVAAGDDCEPDLVHSADEIAASCAGHFLRQSFKFAMRGTEADDSFAAVPEHLKLDETKFRGLMASGKARGLPASTFGVMQPTGDRFFGDKDGPYIDRVAGSAWLGREWCLRINQGSGPLWPEYFHMGVDEELQAVAIKYGVFWQRPDLCQKHNHWGRPREGERIGQLERMPDFLKQVNSPEHWKQYKELFAARKAAGFPGSEPK